MAFDPVRKFNHFFFGFFLLFCLWNWFIGFRSVVNHSKNVSNCVKFIGRGAEVFLYRLKKFRDGMLVTLRVISEKSAVLRCYASLISKKLWRMGYTSKNALKILKKIQCIAELFIYRLKKFRDGMLVTLRVISEKSAVLTRWRCRSVLAVYVHRLWRIGYTSKYAWKIPKKYSVCSWVILLSTPEISCRNVDNFRSYLTNLKRSLAAPQKLVQKLVPKLVFSQVIRLVT